MFPDALRIDLLDPASHREYAARPEKLAEIVKANPGKQQVVLDEVQKVPELLEVVHSLIEAKSGQHFILTGSSARKLRRTGVNLLGGRALHLSLHPYMGAELGERFELSTALRQGMLSIVRGARDPADTCRLQRPLPA